MLECLSEKEENEVRNVKWKGGGVENEGEYLRSLLGACVPGTFRCFSFDLPPQLRALLCEQLGPSQIVDYGIGTC